LKRRCRKGEFSRRRRIRVGPAVLNIGPSRRPYPIVPELETVIEKKEFYSLEKGVFARNCLEGTAAMQRPHSETVPENVRDPILGILDEAKY
jgi:hypothetical protein